MKNFNDSFCIHIGYPKSASTTLQKNLFDKHSDILNMGVYPRGNLGLDTENYSEHSIYINNQKLQEFYHQITMLDSLDYSYNENKNLLLNVLSKYNKEQFLQKKICLFSSERFTWTYFSYPDIGVKAKRLKKLFPKAKIFVIIRNQFDILKSQYRDQPFDPRSFSAGKMVDINKWIKLAHAHEWECRLLPFVNYYRTLNYYTKLFGIDNVGVFLFEELVSQKESFSDKVSLFLNIQSDETLDLLNLEQQNMGIPHHFNLYREFVKRNILRKVPIGKLVSKEFKEKFENKLKKGKKRDYKYSDNSIDFIVKYYSAGNRDLARTFNLDLEKYGYPL